MSKANILFIMTDQQRWDAMGCSGDWVKTPNLDRIAADGVYFSNCVTNSPVCMPARVSLATGRYPHNTGIWNNFHFDMPEGTTTWMQSIRDAGYRTSLFGKTHLHHHLGDLREREYLLHAYGLDDVDEIGGPWASTHVLSHLTARWKERNIWDGYKADYAERVSHKRHIVRPSILPLEEYADVYVGQKAKTYLEKYERSEPWFCWVSFGGPHEPWDAPEPYASMYDPADMPDAIPKPEMSRGRAQGMLDQRFSSAPELIAEETAAMRANYAGNVSLIDAQVGEILQAIEDRGEMDNTVIAFTSDHGEQNGDHGLLYKSTFLNGSVRIPLLIRTPDTTNSDVAGTMVDCPVELFDIGPTLVECAGSELMYQQFAQSLCPLLQGAVQGRDFVISEYDGEIMYMDRKWKMALNTEGVPYLLFDQENDPNEVSNLIMRESNKEIVCELRLKVQEHLVRTQIHLNR